MRVPPNLRTRFAPTPSGYLHSGNAFSFLLTWMIARQNGGKILLRIDDLDAQRKRPEYVADVFESLDWLGLDYDEGPSGPAELEKSFSQHQRLNTYSKYLSKMRESNWLFGCACTRSSVARDNPDGRHPPKCRTRQTALDAENVAWRTPTDPDVTEQWTDADGTDRSTELHATMRDFVVRKKDGSPAYQLASLVDDIELDINFIVRGSDLLESTSAQRLLARRMGEQTFLQVGTLHHELLRTDDGSKLSKSEGAASLHSMRRDGDSRPLFQRLASLLGLPASVTNANEALDAWSDING